VASWQMDIATKWNTKFSVFGDVTMDNRTGGLGTWGWVRIIPWWKYEPVENRVAREEAEAAEKTQRRQEKAKIKQERAEKDSKPIPGSTDPDKPQEETPGFGITDPDKE
jgi:hypothetical protein